MSEIAAFLGLLAALGMATLGTMFMIIMTKRRGMLQTLISSMIAWLCIFFFALGLLTTMLSGMGYPIS